MNLAHWNRPVSQLPRREKRACYIQLVTLVLVYHYLTHPSLERLFLFVLSQTAFQPWYFLPSPPITHWIPTMCFSSDLTLTFLLSLWGHSSFNGVPHPARPVRKGIPAAQWLCWGNLSSASPSSTWNIQREFQEVLSPWKTELLHVGGLLRPSCSGSCFVPVGRRGNVPAAQTSG